MADQETYLLRRLGEMAEDVLVRAALGGMPDTYWSTDSRIKRACSTLGWTPDKARKWAQNQVDG